VGNTLNNTITGNSAANTLNGAVGIDTLNGGDGDDMLDGGSGNDFLNGGSGNDEYWISEFIGGDDIISDTGGNDQLAWISSGANNGYIEFSRSGTSNIDMVIRSYQEGSLKQTTTVKNQFSVTKTTDATISSTAKAPSTALEGLYLSDDDAYFNIINGLTGSGYDDIIVGTAGNNTMAGNAGSDIIFGNSGIDTLNGGTGADRLSGGAGKDIFVFDAGHSGQTSSAMDTIVDYTKGLVGTGDLIDYSQALRVGGSTATATSTQARIASNGVATFATSSGTTLSDALGDIAARFTAATNTAGEFAFFKVNNSGNFHMFISDGAAGVTANDVVIQLVGVTSISTINLTDGNLTILT
jgi:Ca2+-binding RTX toxin-like protein